MTVIFYFSELKNNGFYTVVAISQNFWFFREKRDEEVVCYSDVGCFWDDGPFDYLDMLPSNPDEVGTTMQLFTRKNREKAQLIGTVFSQKNINRLS